MFIVDFDDTLFDTHWFKQERLAALRKLGVSDELYWETYALARNDEGGQVTYTDERHAAAFAGTDIDRQEVLKALKDISSRRIREFLFPDAIHFLKKLRLHNRPVLLLSLGAPSFQQTKVQGTKVNLHVDEVIIVDNVKERVLKHQLTHANPKDVWLINDKIGETQRLLKQFPEIHVVLKQIPSISEEAYEQTGLPYFDSLTDIAIYVKEHI